MKLSIMQPYVFPYLGYFQMIAASDKFVLYDDVNFIKQGWINRNRILLNGKDFLFTIPLQDASSNKLIKQTYIHEKNFPIWRTKFLNTLAVAYRKSPQFELSYNLFESILKTEYKTIDELARVGIMKICDLLSLKTNFVPSSEIYNNKNLRAQDRILDICKKEQATVYINPISGQELYSKKDFSEQGIQLFFIHPELNEYDQNVPSFVSGLSIIDVLMFNPIEAIRSLLKSYRLV